MLSAACVSSGLYHEGLRNWTEIRVSTGGQPSLAFEPTSSEPFSHLGSCSTLEFTQSSEAQPTMDSIEIPLTTESQACRPGWSGDRLEPLAVIGYALEYPQDADTPEGFWKVLTERKDVMTKWPKERFNLEAFYHQDGKQKQQVRS